MIQIPGPDSIIMSREQVREFDKKAINELGIPGVVLMENAGRSCAEVIGDILKDVKEPKVCIFCGTGNNGGDGYVIARHLINLGYHIKVLLCGDPAKVKGDAKINYDILIRMGFIIDILWPFEENITEQLLTLISEYNLYVDALFGTGLQGKLKPQYIQIINFINSLGSKIFAVDIPSGLDCNTAEVLGTAVKADYTVTFVAVKSGFRVQDAQEYIGLLYVASIGIEPVTIGWQ